jgi:hypothetical protein
MGEFVEISEINNALCDKSLLDHFLYLGDYSIIYEKLINTSKYQEIKSKIIENKLIYLKELKNEQQDINPSNAEFYIWTYDLAENILELMSNYHILLTHEGMCNLMNYVFYDVYCRRKSLPPHYSFAKQTVDDEYEDAKFYNPDYIASKWNWDKNTIFLGINENVWYEVNAKKFWKNFAREILQKIGSVYFQLITHDFKEINIVESYNENFFIIQTSTGPPDEPWYEADMFARILKPHAENAKDSSGKFFTNLLYSSNPLPDFYKSETHGGWGTNLYSSAQRNAYGVFQRLIELGISTNTILSGTVSKVQYPIW